MAISLFISYAAYDKPHFDKLEAYLIQIQRQVAITYSHSGQVPPGLDPERWVAERIAESQLHVCLISSDYMAGMYAELTQLLRQRERGAVLVPVLIRPALLERTPLAALVPLPRSGKAVSQWTSADDAWQEIAQGLLAQLEHAQNPSAAGSVVAAGRPGGEGPARREPEPGAKNTMSSPTPNLRKIRKILDEVLRTDSDLEAFCLDFFIAVKRSFSGGMDRNQKVSLLLDKEDHAEVLSALKEAEPQKFAKYRHLLD